MKFVTSVDLQGTLALQPVRQMKTCWYCNKEHDFRSCSDCSFLKDDRKYVDQLFKVSVDEQAISLVSGEVVQLCQA